MSWIRPKKWDRSGNIYLGLFMVVLAVCLSLLYVFVVMPGVVQWLSDLFEGLFCVRWT